MRFRADRADRQRGAMLVIVAAVLALLGAMVLGAFTMSRVYLAKQETQRAADAACLAAVSIIRGSGMPFLGNGGKEEAARQIARGNAPGRPIDIRFSVEDLKDQITVRCETALGVDVPALIWLDGRLTVHGKSAAVVKQVTQDSGHRIYPKLVLVLDYSGSMDSPLGGVNGQPSSINKLRESVKRLIADPSSSNILYGAVLFATGVLASVPIPESPEDTGKLIKIVDQTQNGGSTDSAGALQKAAQLFDASKVQDPDEGKFVFFVSDGAPNNPSAAQTQNATLWDRGVAVISLHIINVPDNSPMTGTLAAFMKSLTGTLDEHPKPEWYINANSSDELDKAFKKLADSIGCPLNPMNPPPADPKNLRLFIKQENGEEVPVHNAALYEPANQAADDVGDLADRDMPFREGYYFFYREKNHTIYVTPKVCGMVVDEHRPVVTRATRGRLTE